MSKKPSKEAAMGLLEAWKSLSKQVREARVTPSPSLANNLIDTFIKEADASNTTPYLLSWKGDNYFAEGKFTEAAKQYQKVLELKSKNSRQLEQLRFGAYKKAARALYNNNEYSKSIKTLDDAAKAFPDEKPSLLFMEAKIMELHSKKKDAEKTYDALIKSSKRKEKDLRFKDAAKRAKLALEKSRGWCDTNPQMLSAKICRALQKKDVDALRSFASQSHFSLGLGASHMLYTNFDALFKRLETDLKRSDAIFVDPFKWQTYGRRLYINTFGWEGEVFNGVVQIVLLQTLNGWEWRGIIAPSSLNTKQLKSLVAKEYFPKNTATRKRSAVSKQASDISIADLGLKCPWPSGRTFRAGGLNKYLVEQALVVFTPWPFNQILLHEYAGRSFGFGINGYYYNQSPTHNSSTDRYSVDFTAYRVGLPYADAAAGTQVLAAASGIVTNLRSNIQRGSTTAANYVEIDHYTDEELLGAFLVWIFTGEFPRSTYSARYLHLDGPGDVRVSDNMYVEQGTILGHMDDTGNSAVPHLHFSMHENHASRAAVRPTPMDNQTLNDNEDGKGMTSTNIAVI